MKKGFTLVELLVVLVVIGVIVGLILPNTLRAIEEANERECASSIRAINTAIQLCYTTGRDATACDTAAELAPNFMDIFPTCPFGGTYTLAAAADSGTPTNVTVGAAGVNNHFATWPPRGIDHE